MPEFTSSYPSILITGMPGTGKTTLAEGVLNCEAYREAIPLPRVTTREPRESDLPGEYDYVTREEFLLLFEADQLLEPSIWHAEMGSHLYGSPLTWLKSLEQGGQVVSPPSIAVAERIKCELGQNVLWTHLFADKNIKRERLLHRGHAIGDVATRLIVYEAGSDDKLPAADISIDTGNLDKEETLRALGAFTELVQ